MLISLHNSYSEVYGIFCFFSCFVFFQTLMLIIYNHQNQQLEKIEKAFELEDLLIHAVRNRILTKVTVEKSPKGRMKSGITDKWKIPFTWSQKSLSMSFLVNMRYISVQISYRVF